MNKLITKAASMTLVVSFVPLLQSCQTTPQSITSSVVAVDDRKLTNKKAQYALNTLAGDSISIQVLGVREESNSSATVDLTFNSLAWGERGPILGPGRAEFIQYNDGRWILTKVYVGDRSSTLRLNWTSQPIEAK